MPRFRWRIPFSLENFITGAWVHGGIRVCYGWIAAPVALAAMRFGNIFNGSFRRGSPLSCRSWCLDSTVFHVGNLRVERFQNVTTLVKLLLIGALIGAASLFHSKQRSVSCCPWRQKPQSSTGIRGPLVTSCIPIRLECVSVYQQRDQAT